MAIGCGGANQGKFYDINPNDGTAVTVGAGHTEPGANCSYQGAFSPIDGFVYYIQGGASPVAFLVRADKTTGIHETIGQLQSPTNEPLHMASLAINSSGEAFGFDPSENFYSIDLTSGVATLVGSNATTMAAFYSLAFDPLTGVLYAALGGSFSPVLQTVNILTGAPTSTGVTLPHYVMGITVDEDALMWVLTNDNFSEVRSYNVMTNTWSTKSDLLVGGSDVYSQSMFFYGTVGGLPTGDDVLSKKFSVNFDGNSAELTKAAKRAIVRKLNSLGDGAGIGYDAKNRRSDIEIRYEAPGPT